MNDECYAKKPCRVPQDFSAQALERLLVPGRAVPYNVSNTLTRDSSLSTDLKEFVELVRRVRHDANNPLTAALGHVQLLLDDPAVTDAEVRDSLHIVESELRRLTEILRQLNAVNFA